MKRKMKFVVIALLVAWGSANLATAVNQRGGFPGPGAGPVQGTHRSPDPLAFLKRALDDAGAPDLTTEQEDQLKTLIENYRESQQSRGPNELQAAHRAYDDAVLAGNFGGAQAQAAIIASLIAQQTRSNLEAQANSQIQALRILTPDQIRALLQRVGTSGLTGLLNSVTRPGPHHRPGPPS